MTHATAVECLARLRDLRGKDPLELRLLFDGMLDALLGAVPASRRHLDVLETMREPLDRALSTLSLRYADRPVAPDAPENDTLLKVVSTWSKMADVYALIAQDTALGNSASTHALLAQRRTDCHARAVLEYMRARRSTAPGLWKTLHESLLDAEARGFAYTRAPDPLNPWQAQSAAEAHSTLLLMDLSSPFSRSPREFGQIWRCARHFAPHCRLLPEGSDADDGRRTAYGLDLHADHGLRPVATMADVEGIRRFESLQLSDRFREVTSRIRKRNSVAELDLDPSVGVEETVRLLLSLYRPWARGSSGRRFARRPGGGTAELTGNWKAIGFYVTGKPFAQPAIHENSQSLYSDMRMLTLGERVADVSTDEKVEIQRAAEHRGYICTQWEILDQSLGGFRLRRHSSAERLEHRELIAIRPRDARNFMLGTISWVMYREDGALETGIRLLEGIPTEVAVRSVGVGKGQYDVSFQQAFRLSETPALKTPATLVLPAGYFQPFRVIELYDGKLRGMRLLELVHRGADFDQATFEVVNTAG